MVYLTQRSQKQETSTLFQLFPVFTFLANLELLKDIFTFTGGELLRLFLFALMLLLFLMMLLLKTKFGAENRFDYRLV